MSLFICSEAELNAALIKYQETVDRESQTKQEIIESVKPRIDSILKIINEIDNRFSNHEVVVGDFYRGLKLKQPNILELSLPLQYTGDHKWTEPSNDWHFSFGRKIDNEATTFEKELQVAVNAGADPNPPGVGYVRLPMTSDEYKDLSCNGYLIPYYVKQRLNAILFEAVAKFKANCPDSGRIAVGDPLTILLDVELLNQTVKIIVNVDLVLLARLPFKTYLGIDWPRKKTLLMLGNISDVICGKLVEILGLGANCVAGQNLYWKVNFAVCEKLLLKHIDGDGGCRRKVYKLMKAFLKLRNSTVISNYELKNVWLWECEKRPSPSDWKSEKMSERFFDAMQNMCHCIEVGRLKQYFYPKVNLLKDTDKEELDKFLVLLIWQELGGGRAFTATEFAAWSTIPVPIRNLSALGQFKTGLKSFFFQQT